jgi:hypothetical protein
MSDSIIILRSCFGLALLWAFWHYVWKAYAVDLLRQSLFTVRNELFDMAMRKEMGLEFNSPVYVALRNSFNSRIRFAHRITFSHIWLGILISKMGSFDLQSYKSRTEEAIEAVENKDLQTKLRALQMKGNAFFVRHLLLISPLFFAIVCVGFLCFLVKFVYEHFSLPAAMRKAFDSTEAKAVEDSKQVIAFQADICEADDLKAPIPVPA